MSVFDALEAKRRAVGPGRLAGLRDAAEELAELVRGTEARRAELIELDRVLVETRVVLPDARLVSPFAVLTRRALLLEAADGARVLVDPSDVGTSSPYEERLASRHPVLARVFAKPSPARSWSPADVVFSTTLALRAIERTRDTLRDVRWLVSREELSASAQPAPRDRARYGGTVGDARSTLEAVDGAVLLAPGVLAIPTPGPTPGHTSVMFAFRGAVHVFTHAGVARDAWSPYESNIPGLREAVRLRSVEAIVRGDSSEPERALESMAIERALADRDASAPAFLRIVPAMALTPALIAPRLRPFSGPALA